MQGFDIQTEADRYFDASSLADGDAPRVVVILGGISAGKTTFRRQHCSGGYVLVDAAEVCLSLSRGEFHPFPGPLEEPLEAVGSRVAQRAVSERRHIVTELVGADEESTRALMDVMHAAGYTVEVTFIECDLDVAMQRNEARGEDEVSSYFAEPYQRRWLLEAAQAAMDSGAKGT